MESFSILDLRGYREIEPMPETLKLRMFWRDQMFWWVWCSVITGFLAGITHSIICVIWLPWWIRTVRHIVNNVRLSRQWHREMKGYEARAMAHHKRVMGQIEQLSNRDWN